MLTPQDPPETPPGDLIDHAHTAEQLPQDKTLFGTLLERAEQMSGIGVPRGLFGHSHEPDRPVCAYTAQKWIMSPDTPLEVRDAVWRYIIEKVPSKDGDWQTYAIVAQYHALKRIAVHLAPKSVSAAKIWRANVDVTASFLVTCGRMEIETPHVGARLVEQTEYHAEKAYWDRDKRVQPFDPLDTEATNLIEDRVHVSGRGPQGHPDFVLIRLIIDTAPPPKNRPPALGNARVVGYQRRRPADDHCGPQVKALDAELVARTRLERVWPLDSERGLRKTIDIAAAEVDKLEGGEVGKKRRKRAEAAIVHHLAQHRRPRSDAEPPAETQDEPPE